MGRTLTWYVIPKNLEHDKSKQICLDLEFEPEESREIKEKVFNIVNPENEEITDTSRESFFKRDKEIREVYQKYRYKDEVWCQKCQMYNNGSCSSSSIDSISVQHSYSNVIWDSDWNIKEQYIGSRTTDFVRRFNSTHLYREILECHVDSAFTTVYNLNTPYRSSDVEAKEETLKVLHFLKTKLKIPNVRVIIQDEL